MNVKVIIIVAVMSAPIGASFWDDVGSFVTKSANTVADGVKDAANAVASEVNKHLNTKATRGVDIGIRIAALTTALNVAKGVLTSTQFLSDQTLEAAYQTANAAVITAEQFLDKVVQNAAYAALEGPSQAAKGVLEGAKQASVGVLKGGQWVTNQSLGQLDITCIHYDGNLQDLAKLKLGNVTVQGKIIAPFSLSMDLDLSNPIAAVDSFAKNLGEMMQHAFLDPVFGKKGNAASLNQTIQQIQQAGTQADTIKNNIAQIQTPPALLDAQDKVRAAQSAVTQQQNQLAVQAYEAQDAIKKAASQSFDQLLEQVKKMGSSSTSEAVIVKEEFARQKRALAKKKKEIDAKLAAQPQLKVPQTPAPQAKPVAKTQ